MTSKDKEQEILISTDSELFIVNTADGTPLPACGLIGGTKKSPIPIPGIRAEGFLMQEDNVTLEFNVPPYNDAQLFVDAVGLAMQKLDAYLSKRAMAIHRVGGSLEYPCLKLPGAESMYPDAFRIGCSPDYCAYSLTPDVPRENPSLGPTGAYRFAGAHFHVSYPNEQEIPPFVFIRLMDLLVNIPLFAMDNQGLRRQIYGKAGLFRPTKYPDGSSGFEYRSFSNSLLFNWNYLERAAYSTMRMVSWVLNSSEEAAKVFTSIPWDQVQTALDTEDLTLAYDVYSMLSAMKLPNCPRQGWYNPAPPKKAQRI